MRNAVTRRPPSFLRFLLACTALALLALTGVADAAVYVEQGNPSCADARTAAQATATAPWCSLTKLPSVPSGETVVVRGGSYPRLSLSDSYKTAPVTVRGERSPVVAGIDLRRTSRWRFERLTSRGRVMFSGTTDAGFYSGEIGPASQGVEIKEGSERIEVIGSHIHDISQTTSGQGQCVRASLGDPDVVTIRGNLCERAQVDGIQTSGVDQLLIQGNELREIRPVPGSGSHTDTIQVMKPGSSSWARIVRNYIHDSTHPPLISGVQRGLVVENNTMARFASYCFRASGAPSARIVNNTFWGCPNGILLDDAQGTNSSEDITPTPTQMDNVLLVNNIYPTVSGGASYAAKAANVTKPLFEDGFELAATSPGVDTADRAFAPATDRLGRPRVNGPDAGSLERQAAIAP
jgi:hypothetical protein